MLTNLASWLVSLSQTQFWIAMLIISALATYAFIQMYQGFYQARLIENIPTAKVRSAPQGYVELSGLVKALPDSVLLAPLSQRPCLWYYFKVEKRVYSTDSKGRGKSKWVVEKQGTSEAPFLLNDQTADCIINPIDAEVITEHKRSWQQGAKRYTEKLIRENEYLYVIGLFKNRAHMSSQQIREQMSQLLAQWKQDQASLLKNYDKNQDGEISLKEWKQVQQDAQSQTQQELAELADINVMQSPEQKGHPYLLSTLSEKKLIQKFYRKGLLASAGFLIVGTALVWSVNIRLGW